MKVALYARTGKQAEPFCAMPIKNQLRKLRDYCKSHGHEIIKQYVDENALVTDMTRPGFWTMTDDIQEGAIEVEAVMVVTTSMLFGDKNTYMNWSYLLKENGVRIFAIAQHCDESNDFANEFMQSLFVIFDDHERRIAEFVQR